jgi:hypothetical protein
MARMVSVLIVEFLPAASAFLKVPQIPPHRLAAEVVGGEAAADG